MRNVKSIDNRICNLYNKYIRNPLLITVYLPYWSPNDPSARQTEKQRTFGATYMTMNNPYFQVLDTQIRSLLELKCGKKLDNIHIIFNNRK